MAGESNRGPVRVFVAGTFDGLHLGHLFLFDFARRRGMALARRQSRDGVYLSVVVARDEGEIRLNLQLDRQVGPQPALAGDEIAQCGAQRYRVRLDEFGAALHAREDEQVLDDALETVRFGGHVLE